MNICLECGNETKTKFCSHVCGTTYYHKHNDHYRVKAGTKLKINCKWCGKELLGDKCHSKRKCCDRHCAAEWKWINVTIPKILAGEITIDGVATLKKYLIYKNGHICSRCTRTEWNGEPIPLEIEHIDGNFRNNQLTNVKLLCANCHRQTPTWGMKKTRRELGLMGRHLYDMEKRMGSIPIVPTKIDTT